MRTINNHRLPRRSRISAAVAFGLLCTGLSTMSYAASLASVAPAASVAANEGGLATQDASAAAQTPQTQPVIDTQPNSKKAVNLNAVTVLGSRIPLSSVAEARPVIVMTAAQIEATGLVNVGQILQHITSAGSAVNSHIDVGGNGETNLDLRNLGSNRVLILVNGKRWITGLGGSVNLDQIPASVIENIEVLKDGASAIYGSDAIAGVVNITTRKNFEGAKASAYVGGYNDKGLGNPDGITQQYSYLLGYGNDKGNIVVGVEYQENNGIDNCARAFTCHATYGTLKGSSFGPQGRYEFYPPSDSPLYSNSDLCPPSGSGVPFCDVTVKPGALGSTLSDFKHWNNNTDQYNYAQLYQVMAPNTSANLYVQGSYALTTNVSFHSTIMYNHHYDLERYSPSNLDVGAGGIASLISASNPYNPFGIDLNSNVSSPQPGVGQLILAGLRPIAGGFRNFEATTDTYYFNGGLDGAFSWGQRDFIWNADYTYGHELVTNLTLGGLFNLNNFGLALGPVSNCGPGSPNPSCVPLAFFGSERLTPAMVQYVGVSSQSQTMEELRDYQINLSSGNILDLPAGSVGFNVGYEFRKLGGADHPDSLQQAGISTNGASQATSGGYTVKSQYGEINVPLLANLPLVKEFDLDLAARRSQFSTFGSATTKQGGLRWQPNSQLLVRGTVAQGFRAPNIGELFQGLTNSGPYALDPCNKEQLVTESAQTLANCRAAGVSPDYTQPINGELYNATVGGNPKVQPETSLSKTAGFVYNPDFLQGFNVNADYFRIAVNNLISRYGAQNILNACYISGVQKFCQDIFRNNTGIILNLNDIETNVGNILTEGYDLGSTYTFGTSVGTFKAALQATYTKKYDQSLPSSTGGAPEVQHLRGWEIGSNFQGFPKLKAIWSVDWNLRDWSAVWRMRYVSSMIEDCTNFIQYGICTDPNPDHESYTGTSKIPIHYIRATTYQDASVTYAFKSINTHLTLGINNLMNKEPAISYTALNENFDPTIYDIPGRFVYLRVTTDF